MASFEFSYSGNPSDSTHDETRFLIGDTDEANPMFQDGEILWALTEQSDSALGAAILLAETAAQAKFARTVSFRIGDVSKSASDIQKQFAALAKSLKKRAAKNVLPFFGGLTKSGKETLDERTDDVQPSFSIGQDENPQALDPQVLPKGSDLSGA